MTLPDSDAARAPLADTNLDVPGLGGVLASSSDPARWQRQPWYRRVLDAGSAYLPLFLMALLAVGTWWLVNNTPSGGDKGPAAAPRHEPDYTMKGFMVQRFGPDGRLHAQIEGDVMRHYPDTDTLEVDNARVHSRDQLGNTTLATARQATSNGAGTHIQLQGQAQVVRETADKGPPTIFRGEFLEAFVDTEQVRSHLPVTVTRAGTEVHAERFDYNHQTQVVQMTGRVRASFAPRGSMSTGAGMRR